MELLPRGARTMALARLAYDTEVWLRTGTYRGVTTSTDEATSQPNVRIARLDGLVGEHLEIDLTSGLVPRASSTNLRVLTLQSLSLHVNVDACDVAIAVLQKMFLVGPAAHLARGCAAHLVAPAQSTPCADCGASVAALHCMLFAHTHSSCRLCNAARCVPCGQARAHDLGKPHESCLRCGGTDDGRVH